LWIIVPKLAAQSLYVKQFGRANGRADFSLYVTDKKKTTENEAGT